MNPVLEVLDEGHLRVLRLNRPDRKNALNWPLFGGLAQAFRDAAHDDDVWVVALTGNGDAFCAGLDLAAGGDAETDATATTEAGTTSAASPPRSRDRKARHDTAPAEPAPAEIMAKLMRIECDKPIVAGINGATVGFGVSLAMGADIRLAAPAARFHPGYARVGTSPDGGATWTLPMAVGYERALRFFLESRAVPADEALRIGMVSEVTDSDEAFPERFLAYARQLVSVAPIAARQTKRLMARISQPPDLEGHLRDEVQLALSGLATADASEAMRALAAREQPTFHGR